jgi:radical SAM superfamily enzyme YgiQ (UPF0313 family)
MRLWEAGCSTVTLGIEGLSTRYLKRLGKGTSTIQNLQALKTCFELEIANQSNLLTGFPGCSSQCIGKELVLRSKPGGLLF